MDARTVNCTDLNEKFTVKIPKQQKELIAASY